MHLQTVEGAFAERPGCRRFIFEVGLVNESNLSNFKTRGHATT